MSKHLSTTLWERGQCSQFRSEFAEIIANFPQIVKLREREAQRLSAKRTHQREHLERLLECTEALGRALSDSAGLYPLGTLLGREAELAGKSKTYFVTLGREVESAASICRDMLAFRLHGRLNSHIPNLAWLIARLVRRHGGRPSGHETGDLANLVREALEKLAIESPENIRPHLRAALHEAPADPETTCDCLAKPHPAKRVT